jgi:hypothetical protein
MKQNYMNELPLKMKALFVLCPILLILASYTLDSTCGALKQSGNMLLTTQGAKRITSSIQATIRKPEIE